MLIAAASAAASALVACGAASRGAGEPVGVSDGAHGGAPSVRDAGPDGAGRGKGAAAAGLSPDYRNELQHVNRARFVSNGHAAGRWDADVYATTAGKEAALSTAAGGELPVGTRLVMEHTERTPDTHPAGPLMVMEKMEKGFDPDHGDWRYVVVGASGDLVQQGRIESCAGCHDDAPRDHVFRITE